MDSDSKKSFEKKINLQIVAIPHQSKWGEIFLTDGDKACVETLLLHLAAWCSWKQREELSGTKAIRVRWKAHTFYPTFCWSNKMLPPPRRSTLLIFLNHHRCDSYLKNPFLEHFTLKSIEPKRVLCLRQWSLNFLAVSETSSFIQQRVFALKKDWTAYFFSSDRENSNCYFWIFQSVLQETLVFHILAYYQRQKKRSKRSYFFDISNSRMLFPSWLLAVLCECEPELYMNWTN